MRTTLAYVQEFTKKAGMQPVQIDGIPEGFSYQMEGIEISGNKHEGSYVAFIPLSDDVSVVDKTIEGLLAKYKQITK